MITFDLVINPVILMAAVIVGVGMGLLIGRIMLTKSRAKIQELEKEMMSAHAEILEIQKAYVQLENKLEEHSIPVISMRTNGKDNNNSKEKASK
jgi:phage terminase Nu1 subunit (DNA packaging protein)